MSHIGRQPITLPSDVKVVVSDDIIVVTGPKGELKQKFNPKLITITIKDATITLTRKNDEARAKSLHGLYRSLLQNMIIGVSEGFRKSLEVRGVGYRAKMQGTQLELNLGYSHSLSLDTPPGLNLSIDSESPNIIHVDGIDKQSVGQMASRIRDLRRPEPYKGKGVRYANERVVLKAGKSASAKEK